MMIRDMLGLIDHVSCAFLEAVKVDGDKWSPRTPHSFMRRGNDESETIDWPMERDREIL
jgi:hypothetical protein